mmetsp:Transcript_95380/g.269679  ORF Transcript_95380/g.269679 Transcript_95380/m.269679 type:complete len:236 (-) Transcript_95380:109-816(-)
MMPGALGLPEKDPARQWEWHEAYRDLSKNMYRTSYTDATHFRETYVKSDFPAGYGGHVPSTRHDVLFRNTDFDRKQALMRQDPNRDASPSFCDQIAGVPTYTRQPCGAKKHPTYKVSLHDGTTRGMAPWGITVNPRREPLNMRTSPPTMKRWQSMPGLQQRSNSAAMGVGSMMAGGSDGMQYHMQETPQRHNRHQPQSPTSPGADRLRRTVDSANEVAMRRDMPTEADILHENIG